MTRHSEPHVPDDLLAWQALYAQPAILTEIATADESELALQNRLREKYEAEVVRLALNLHQVRQRFGAKLGISDGLWLTRRLAEQATSWPIAVYKAEQLTARGRRTDELWDGCCGAGIDAIAFAKFGPVIACDRDPLALQLAAWNAEAVLRKPDAANPRFDISFRSADVGQIDFRDRWVHLDPDQRDAQGRRTLRLEQVQPELSQLQSIAEQCRGGVIKLSPASNFGGKFPDVEIELVSWQGECKLAAIWCGEAATPHLCRATVLPSGATLAGDPLAAWPEFSPPDAFVYDPDPAIVRAGLINLLAEQSGFARLDEQEEYLTSSTPVDSPFCTRFALEAVLGRNDKQLRKYLRERNVGIVEIKCRHLPIDVEKVRRKLALSGAETRTLIFARVAGKSQVLVCRRD